MEIRGFPPIVDSFSRVLVLGSMPGPESLRRGQYYGYGANSFWKILARLFGGSPDAGYDARVRLLLSNCVALWDVLASCRRAGASDGAIRAPRPNDFEAFFAAHPRIGRVFFNGRAAEKFFLRCFGGLAKEKKLLLHALPSTSPAFASLGFDGKLSQWRALSRAVRARGRKTANNNPEE